MRAEFKTTQCDVEVWNTDVTLMDETVMIIVTHHRENRKTLVRFGTKKQMYSILGTYRNSVIAGREDYERIWDACWDRA